MPYIIQKNQAGKFCVHKENADKSPGETVHCHDTEDMAKRQMAALYAAESKALELLNDAIKIGARNNAGDAKRLQDIHDAAVACGAKCDMDEMGDMEGKSADTDTLIFYGAEVKALGDGRVGGYLLRYSGPNDPDLTADFFTRETYTGKAEQLDVYYQHGLDPQLGKRVIGEAKAKRDDVGLWVEAQLNMRDAYEKQIYELARAGKLGWSSGAVSHLVERKAVGNAHHVTRWPIAEASLTPTPAEPRNAAISLKSFATTPGWAALDGAGDVPQTTPSTKGATPMSDNTAPAPSNELAELKAQLAELTAELRKPALPAKTAPAITEVADLEAEKPFKTLGEQLTAIKNSANGRTIDKRLLAIQAKATGMNELVGADGGFLLQNDFAIDLALRAYNTGAILSRVSRTPIGPNANGLTVAMLNETSRATGSRFGGAQAYWLNEGGTKTASRPTFRRMVLNLEKVIGLYYSTDELLMDSTALGSVVAEAFRQEVTFTAEDAVINGSGAGQPLGVLNAPATVSVSKETGQAAATLVFENIQKMWSRMWAASRANAVWFINQDVEPQLNGLSKAVGVGGVPVYLPPGGLSQSPLATLMGRPVIPVEYCATLGTVGDIILADMSQYQWIDKGAPETASSIHVQFVTDETAFRIVWRVNGAPKWNSALTPFKGTNTLSPFVTLATRA